MIDLRKTIQQYPDSVNNARLMKWLLMDLYPQDKKRDIRILASCIECGIVEELRKKTENTVCDIDRQKYVQKLENEYGYAAILCKPIIDQWIDALPKKTNVKPINRPVSIPDKLQIGDEILFGSYCQTSADKEEPIKWIVLAKETDKVLLLSKRILEIRPYNEKLEYTNWRNCSIRRWLNDSFYLQAFSENEKQLIVLAYNNNKRNPLDRGYSLSTTEKIFLLNHNEVVAYLGTTEKCVAELTPYAKNLDVFSPGFRLYGPWWLRDPGKSLQEALFISTNGSISSPSGIRVSDDSMGVRPAFWLKHQTKDSSTINIPSWDSGEKNDETENYGSDYKYPSPPPSNKWKKWLIAIIIFMLFMSWCSSGTKTNSSTKSTATKSYIYPTKTTKIVRTPTNSYLSDNNYYYESKIGFQEKYITIMIGSNYELCSVIPSNNKGFAYQYDAAKIEILKKDGNCITISGRKDGLTKITLVDEKKEPIDYCYIQILDKNPTISSTPTITKTIKPTSAGWVFEKEKINIYIGETVELNYSTPNYVEYYYNLLSFVRIIQIEKNKLSITGLREGSGQINLMNSYNTPMATCMINVLSQSTSTPKPSSTPSEPTRTPVPLTNKKDGYTVNELENFGYIPTFAPNGSIKFSGFYQAPNGNYFRPGH